MAFALSRRLKERLRRAKRAEYAVKEPRGRGRRRRGLAMQLEIAKRIHRPPDKQVLRLDNEAKRGFAPAKTTLVKAPKRPA
jgi:hypothetical protein